MTFEAIYDAAVNVVNQIAAGGEPLSPDKTVCVICSGTGRIYYGVSRVDMVNGAPVDIHAEIDAMRNMQDMGENKVDTLILIDSFNRIAMLPCANCVGFILSQNPENSMGNIAMPDRLIPLSEVGMYAGGTAPPGGGFAPPPVAPAPAPTPAPTPAPEGWAWPVPCSSRITSRYGNRIDPFTGAVRYHSGIDIDGYAHDGYPIVAAKSGTVSAVNYNDGYGNYVIIDHGDGYMTLYAHMSGVAVSYGSWIGQGQTVGYLGATGRATGTHCHFEVYVWGSRTDPVQFYSWMNLSYWNC